MTISTLVPAEALSRTDEAQVWHGGLSASENFLHLTLIVEKQPSKGIGTRPLALDVQFPDLFAVSVEHPDGTVTSLAYGVASGADPLVTSLVANVDAAPGNYVLKIDSATLDINYSRAFSVG